MTARFTGFPEEAIAFFDELELNNNREWFGAHRDVYERAVRDPMRALVGELEAQFGETKIFRVNRDIRFSADKSPYKTWAAAVVGGNYLSLSSEGLYAGGGVYMPESAYLKRFRAAIADDRTGPALERIVANLRRKKYRVETHEMLKTAPKGYAKNHPRIELLRHKDLTAGKGWAPGTWLGTRETLTRVKKVFTDLRPLKEWLATNVG